MPACSRLPVIWGGEEPKFKSEDDTRTTLDTIMGHYIEIVVCFNTDADARPYQTD